VTAALVHIARWLAFQLGETERPAERPASITFFSASADE
jgi:hypothetical protein